MKLFILVWCFLCAALAWPLSDSETCPSEARPSGHDPYTCVRRNDGVVWCAGYNGNGQLGDGTVANRTNPVRVAGLSNVVMLSVGGGHNCAIRDDATLWCWGRNESGQVGCGQACGTNVLSPVQVNLGPGIQVTRVVASGLAHTCAVASDGSLFCWGNNTYGQLGIGNTVNANVPRRVPSITSVFSLALGYQHSCATAGTRSNMGLFCWGRNNRGQLGLGPAARTDQWIPIRVASLDVQGRTLANDVTAGSYHTCAGLRVMMPGGGIVCWGDNSIGQLGRGSFDSSRHDAPLLVNVNNQKTRNVTAGASYTCSWTMPQATVDPGQQLYCWGQNSAGQLGLGNTVSPVVTPALVNACPGATPCDSSLVEDVYPGLNSTCIRTADKRLKCFGNNNAGQLLDGSTASSSSAVLVKAVPCSPWCQAVTNPNQPPPVCQDGGCAATNPRIANVRTLVPPGAANADHPRFSNSGTRIIYDKLYCENPPCSCSNAECNGPGDNPDWYDVFVMDLNGNDLCSVTAGQPGINAFHNGNARFHPTEDLVVLQSEETNRYPVPGGTRKYAQPGYGLYSNLWAANSCATPRQFWKLTWYDYSLPGAATLSPSNVSARFNREGTRLMWTQNYDWAQAPWGWWRVVDASFRINDPVCCTGLDGCDPSNVVCLLDDNGNRGDSFAFSPRILVDTALAGGTYVTAMGYDPLDPNKLLIAGSFSSGVAPMGMDEYLIDPASSPASIQKNFTNSPLFWEEDSIFSPAGNALVYMSNRMSSYYLDFRQPTNWEAMPRQREWIYLDRSTGVSEQLSYLGTPAAPEYVGYPGTCTSAAPYGCAGRVNVSALDYSPTGQYLAGRVGVDMGNYGYADPHYGIVLIEFKCDPDTHQYPDGSTCNAGQ